ncbi:MAG TPA: hypothetical protein VF008_22720 [Niastella sp.]
MQKIIEPKLLLWAFLFWTRPVSDQTTILIPPMLLQPFTENAIPLINRKPDGNAAPVVQGINGYRVIAKNHNMVLLQLHTRPFQNDPFDRTS